MADDTPDQAAAKEPERRSGGYALAVLFALLAIVAAASAVYAWRQQQAAEQQRKAAQAQATLAERNFKAAKATIDAVMSDLAAGLRDASGMRAEVAHAILAKAEAALDKLVTQTESDADIRRSEGAMYIRFAETYMRLGDHKLALESARKGTEVFRALGAQYPDNLDLQSNIALSLDRVGEVLQAQNDLKGTIAAYRESLEISRAIAEKDRGNTQWRIDVALSLWRLADVGDDPRRRLTEALTILKQLKLQTAFTPAQEEWVTTLEGELTRLPQ